MKSVWRGHIRFSLVNIPIQIFNAVNKGNDIRFNQLHKEDMGRVKYKKVCQVCEETLSSSEIIKGYEFEDDQYVVIEKNEFDSIKIKSTKTIEVEAFIDLDEVHPSRYEAVYFVGPHEEMAVKTFNLFIKALQSTGKAGVGKIVLRDKEDVVLLKPYKNGLIMYKLRYPYEVRAIEDVPGLVESEIDGAQLELAETLIKSLTKPFSEVVFKDAYHEAMVELIEAKVEGKELVASPEIPDAPVIDIMEALKASIEEAKAKKEAG